MTEIIKAESKTERNLVSLEWLRLFLNYDPETGMFTWLQSNGNRAVVGAVAGYRKSNGYRCIMIDGRNYREHRLAWIYVHGSWPVADIDHIDGVRDNNRIRNLREASRTQNLQNARRRCDNTSGYKGAYFDARRGTWYSNIKVFGSLICLASGLASPEAAHSEYCTAAKKYFGEFARLD